MLRWRTLCACVRVCVCALRCAEIGDRGINLSGGQKQRVALARAVYARPEVLLFDDPLSAVDANVGEHIFNKCINGSITQGATRILVTNQLHLLPQCDFIYVMKDGEVAEEGTYATLMAAGGELPSLVRQSEQEAAKDEAEGDESGDEVVDDTTAVDPGMATQRSAPHLAMLLASLTVCHGSQSLVSPQLWVRARTGFVLALGLTLPRMASHESFPCHAYVHVHCCCAPGVSCDTRAYALRSHAPALAPELAPVA